MSSPGLMTSTSTAMPFTAPTSIAPTTAPMLNTTRRTSSPSPPLTSNGPVPTSLADNGLSNRPRDARTLHILLSSLGVSAYQERVPLQLLDFAYRYTAGVLSDAQHLAAEGYVTTNGAVGAGKKAADKDKNGDGEGAGISLASLKLATASRNGYQFGGVLPKETALEMAQERNRVRLPEVGKEVVFGVRLPHERFVMTGTGWNLLEEWDSEGEVEEEEEAAAVARRGVVEGVLENGGDHGEDLRRDEGEGEGEKEDEDMADEDGFEQVFGREDEREEEDMEEG